jgi:hypothetical protein
VLAMTLGVVCMYMYVFSYVPSKVYTIKSWHLKKVL